MFWLGIFVGLTVATIAAAFVLAYALDGTRMR